ncbi:MAG: lipocalin-like domain-containing protein [Muribaculum sp.]|nr:lipocalin-like domain-containing protein [Muribaculaceae bacterium]MCM1081463.1 lipocalin-like domain-containing protein [Muribaculum sp.]
MKLLNIIFLNVVLLLCVSLGSCEKSPLNGELDNMWQVMSIENVATGEVTKPDQIYYCIYRDVIQLTGVGRGTQTGVLEYKNHVLSVTFPMAKDGDLLPWAIPGTTERFDVKLHSGKMTLRSATAVLKLKKF